MQLTTSRLGIAEYWDHFLARWAINRNKHLVEPGLYALGDPVANSPVFVTANYTLSFDALRSALGGVDGYILALDTKGVNVWCAAGKGTFGTDELVHRIEASQLKHIVDHRELILPQLGAPGVVAHEVRKRSGFKVVYGPVRSTDLPKYLQAGEVSPEMRRVKFTLWDRITLIPVELVFVLIPLLVLGLLLRSLGAVSAILAGVVLFPILLPWLPTNNFSTKGYILGGIVALPFALNAYLANPDLVIWQRIGWTLAYVLTLPPITAYLALNFTGSSTFTSRTGVRTEIFRYAPSMAWMFGIGIILMIPLFLTKVWGG
ncbi:MAG: carbon monoxide dehydrogenase [Anaerolineales bacterium]|nr:carbon monoxide dehydrogenase [Chloroflexota bacterium]MBL6980811.1 carbon monoxide dehydrogenase [Anaerolineales bacterium]